MIKSQGDCVLFPGDHDWQPMIVTVSQYVTNDKMELYINGLLNKYISCIVISLTSQFYHLLAVETEIELLDVWHLDMCVRN